MSNLPIGEDIGYSSTKVRYNGKNVKFPTAICFATDIGTTYGDADVYEFEGETYYVGKDAVSQESFSTTDYKFLYKFGPLLTYHVLKKFNEHNLEKPVEVQTGLSITDWGKMKEFKERMSHIEVNGESIDLNIKIIPQGAGVIMDYVHNVNDGVFPDRICALDIGHNTINFISFKDGRPVRNEIKGYPGHGVTSILKPFTTYLENKFSLSFSEQEAIGIFVKGSFKFNGQDHPEIKEKIAEIKKQFVTKLWNSVLVNDKKVMGLSDVVLLAGGGSLLLADVEFPQKNIIKVPDPVFSNVRGYLAPE